MSLDRDPVAELGRAAADVTQLLSFTLGGVNVSGLFFYPMVRVMGGLISFVFLTLLMLPYITLGTEGVANRLRRIWRGS